MQLDEIFKNWRGHLLLEKLEDLSLLEPIEKGIQRHLPNASEKARVWIGLRWKEKKYRMGPGHPQRFAPSRGAIDEFRAEWNWAALHQEEPPIAPSPL